MEKKIYACVGCREIHYDNDYCKEDGDLEIFDFERTLESIERVKTELAKERKR